MRLLWLVPLACLSLLGCEWRVAHGLGREPAPPPAERRRAGCRLNLATHIATCACALPEDIDQLPDRPDFESLDIELDAAADPAGLDRLVGLRSLRLRNLTQEKLARVVQLSQLRTLSFSAVGSVDLAVLVPMQNLTSLTVDLGDAIPVCDISPLAKLTRLEKVTLAMHCDHEIDITPLAALPALRDVTLYGVFPSTDLETRLPNAKVTVRRTDASSGNICDIDPSACPRVSACQ